MTTNCPLRLFVRELPGCANATLLLLAFGQLSHAAIHSYAPDANTLHLWHLDEAAAPANDSGSSPVVLQVLANGATLGNTSFPGFSSGLNTAASTTAYLAPLTLVNGAGDETSFSYSNATTGEFTFEAIIRLDADLTQTFVGTPRGTAPLHIFGGEGEANGNRVWQFRIDPIGFNPNADGVTTALTVPALEFINVNLAVAPVQNRVMFLPLTGPDAVELGAWYHVAIVYNGNEATPNNLSAYWTKIDGTRTQADLLIQRQLDTDLPVAPNDFAIGNIGRNPSSSNFVGMIDEVRISDTARTASQFIFAVPEPSAALFLAASGILISARRRPRLY
jgi:hypothetical protein